jgi:8-oxo-dGTP pyrophosphatase MutT (NUDIX family)
MPERRELVRAAGGVLWRRGESGVEVLLVHRPRYDDWSFPKGKCEPGESFLDAARREVTEETGLLPVVGRPLSQVAYLDRRGRPKIVRYWTMSVGSGTFAPNDEVDEVAWLPIGAARDRLSYPRDGVLLDRFGGPGPGS